MQSLDIGETGTNILGRSQSSSHWKALPSPSKLDGGRFGAWGLEPV